MSIWNAVLRTLVANFVKHRRTYRDVVDLPNVKATLETDGKAKTAGRIAGRALKRFRGTAPPPDTTQK